MHSVLHFTLNGSKTYRVDRHVNMVPGPAATAQAVNTVEAGMARCDLCRLYRIVPRVSEAWASWAGARDPLPCTCSRYGIGRRVRTAAHIGVYRRTRA